MQERSEFRPSEGWALAGLQTDRSKMTEMFSQQGEKVEFEKPVEAKGAAAKREPSRCLCACLLGSLLARSKARYVCKLLTLPSSLPDSRHKGLQRPAPTYPAAVSRYLHWFCIQSCNAARRIWLPSAQTLT